MDLLLLVLVELYDYYYYYLRRRLTPLPPNGFTIGGFGQMLFIIYSLSLSGHRSPIKTMPKTSHNTHKYSNEGDR